MSVISAIRASPLAKTLVDMSEGQLDRLAEGERRGLVELAPVLLPEPQHVVGENDHFGWPVATAADGVIVVCYLRRRTHLPAPMSDGDSSGCMMIRSFDGGASWTAPRDLREVQAGGGPLPSYEKGMCIGTTAGGAVVFGAETGTFRSEDRGASWRFHPHRFIRDLEEGRRTTFNCPRFVEHPEHGLVRWAPIKSGPTMPDFIDELHVAASPDGGRTWAEERHEIPAIAKPAEPCALLHDGALIMVGRCHSKKPPGYDPVEQTTGYVQLWSRSGWFPLQAQVTTMRTTDREVGQGMMHSGYGLDTVDLSFNPVTERLEVVATNRSGGGEGRYHAAQFSLNLWSIDPEELLAGSAAWRFEGSLFERCTAMAAHQPGSYRLYMDGCHPAATVIDAARGVQHIFIYLGCMQGPAGIFRVTRTLQTDRLSRFLRG